MQVVPFHQYKKYPGYLDGFYRAAVFGAGGAVYHQGQTLWARGLGQCTDAPIRLSESLNPINTHTLSSSSATCTNKALCSSLEATKVQGRVEVQYNGVWGSICSDSWDHDDASLFCKQLNGKFVGGAAYFARPMSDDNIIWLDDLKCQGPRQANNGLVDRKRAESNRLVNSFCDCSHNGWGKHDCSHTADAGAWCFTDSSTKCNAYQYADKCSAARYRHWRRGAAFTCQALERQGMDCEKAKECGLCDNSKIPDSMKKIDLDSTSMCELAEQAVRKVCWADSKVPFPKNPPVCSAACSKVLASVNRCHNGRVAGNAAPDRRLTFNMHDIFTRHKLSSIKSLWSKCNVSTPPDLLQALCHSAIEGYATLCDGEECCFSKSMLGFDDLWKQCSTILQPVSVSNFTQWMNPDFTKGASTYGCNNYTLKCPVTNVWPSSFKTSYSRQRRLLSGDCCSEDDDCAVGLHCDRRRRTCAAECTDNLKCPVTPSTTVTWSVYPKKGFLSPHPKCSLGHMAKDILPVPHVTVWKPSSTLGWTQHKTNTATLIDKIQTSRVELSVLNELDAYVIVLDVGRPTSAGALLLVAPSSNDCYNGYSPPTVVKVKVSNVSSTLWATQPPVEVATFSSTSGSIKWCCSKRMHMNGICSKMDCSGDGCATVDPSLHTQRLTIPRAAPAQYWMVEVSKPMAMSGLPNNVITIADIALESTVRQRSKSNLCEMQSRCRGDPREICQTACTNGPDGIAKMPYVGPVCLVQCARDPHSWRNKGEPAAICDAAVGGCSLRLRDGVSANQGRLEVFWNGTWGTICDSTWSRQDATVACKQMGFDGGFNVPDDLTPAGYSIQPILLDNVQCKGNEQTLCECSHSPWTQANALCSHDRDIGVFCFNQDSGDAHLYRDERLAIQFDLCSMIRHQYGFWTGYNWGDDWSCASIETKFNISCTQAQILGNCAKLPTIDNTYRLKEIKGSDSANMTSHFHCELIDTAIQKVCCFDNPSADCSKGLPEVCSNECAKAVLTWDIACAASRKESPADVNLVLTKTKRMDQMNPCVAGTTNCKRGQSYDRDSTFKRLVRQCRKTLPSLAKQANVTDRMLCEVGLEGYARVCDGEECCNEPLLRSLLNTCVSIIGSGNMAKYSWLSDTFRRTNQKQEYDKKNWNSSYCKTYDKQYDYGTRCPSGNSSQGKLTHGDCCSEDAHCAGTLVCDVLRRVCTSRCASDATCPLEPASLVGYGTPRAECVLRYTADKAKQIDKRVCLMESRCTGQPGPEVRDIGDYGLCRNECPSYVGPVCDIMCGFNRPEIDRAAKCNNPASFIRNTTLDCDGRKNVSLSWVGDGICDDGRRQFPSANLVCDKYYQDFGDCRNPEKFDDPKCDAKAIRSDTCMVRIFQCLMMWHERCVTSN
jgi:ribosomal protein L13E